MWTYIIVKSKSKEGDSVDDMGFKKCAYNIFL